ncbi:hypothetical protein CPBF367_01780 [Xanthomonas arboricola pv. juglandis]|nr:hypothetical protein CPBF367_01780 [Xanthomonas arboricola pv. juglandis]
MRAGVACLFAMRTFTPMRGATAVLLLCRCAGRGRGRGRSYEGAAFWGTDGMPVGRGLGRSYEVRRFGD